MWSSLILILLVSHPTFADEGMWTFDTFPVQKVEKKYGFKVTPPWLDHVRLSSARLAGGCSASFVSKDGLVMTNHHCAHSCIEHLSTDKKDFVASGFYAAKENEEVRCPEMEINRLLQTQDVTARLNKATTGLIGKAFNDKLKAEMSIIEGECSGANPNLRCEVVTLYHGGQYYLYKYQRYQDVRLVFAPEFAVAFFGGDPDNFMFPRWDLDVSFVRVYENGKPLQNSQYFRWSAAGPRDGDLTFVTGHPGKTSRLLTISQLETERDFSLPKSLFYLSEYRGLLTEFQNRGPEQKRISQSDLFGVENSLKALKGRYEALVNRSFFVQKQTAEKELRTKISANRNWKRSYASAWTDVEGAENEYRKIYNGLRQKEQTNYNSDLYKIAKTLVRAADELPKANEKRLREFTDSKIPELKQRLFSAAPIYDEFEITKFTFALTKARETLGADDPFVKKILGPKSPAEFAKELILNTKLKDIQVRKDLYAGGAKAIGASKDPLIQFALLIDPDARAIRAKYEDDIETIFKRAGEKVAQAQFKVYGTDTYPDATFTLRISYGAVKGFDNNGQWVNPFTDLAGAFTRATGREPFALPQSWLKAQKQLDLTTPFDFATTNDIIGGNSGSPVINAEGEIVGLIFDGNIFSLGGEFGFDENLNRAIAVDSAALLEALTKIYHADRLSKELTQ